jgi:FkbM family methyltransferase
MTCEELKILHDKRQEGLAPNQMRIRDGIVIDIHDEEARFGYEFFCWRSVECVVEMDCFIRNAEGKKSFLDVGAGHGIYALVFLKINPNGVVHCFEPYEKSFEVLKKNCENENISCYNMALSDMTGWVTVVDIGKSFFAKCSTGDDMILPFEAPDIIKIDVEGQELSVLRGLVQIIKSFHPMIFIELHDHLCDIKPVEDWLIEYYKDIFVVTEKHQKRLLLI